MSGALDDPGDTVRLEIEAALARGVRVIPILAEGAVMPGRNDLPESLAGLAHRNAIRIRHESFRNDAERLVAAIERILAPAPGATAAPGALQAHGARSAGTAAGEAVQEGSRPARNDLGRAVRLFADAERIASSITDEVSKASALRDVALALAVTDPDRAERIAYRSPMGGTLSSVAPALAATDPDRAERIANSIPGDSSRAWALSRIAPALAATDPGRAIRVLANAERIARSIRDKPAKARELSDVARTLAAADPDGAERIAKSIPDKPAKVSALSRIAVALAATDPDRAERIANSMPSDFSKALALSGIAEVLVATSS